MTSCDPGQWPTTVGLPRTEELTGSFAEVKFVRVFPVTRLFHFSAFMNFHWSTPTVLELFTRK